MKYHALEYHRHLGGIPVKIDETDHLEFYCPDCCTQLQVLQVMTQVVDGNNCTHAALFCQECGGVGQRKFYWEPEVIQIEKPAIKPPTTN